MATANIETLLNDYLDAFQARDVDKCVTFFAPDASIDFQGTTYTGTDSVRDWHKDRFEANLRILKVESQSFTEDAALAEIVVASDRLGAWRIQQLNGQFSAKFRDGKISEVKLAARMTNIFDMLRSDG